jgi:hypothetical protein
MLQNLVFNFSNQKLLHLYEDITNRVRLFEFDEDALSELATCQKKAFVGSAEEIEDFVKFNKKQVPLVRGKEKFLPNSFVWRIPYTAGGFVHRRMSLLISSGIYSVWEKSFNAKTREQLDISLKKTIEAKQSLDTNLGALFKLIALAWILCVHMLFIEIFVSRKNRILRVWLVIQRLISIANLRTRCFFVKVRLSLLSKIPNFIKTSC